MEHKAPFVVCHMLTYNKTISKSEYTGHMVKHGSSRLRYALMNCCLPLISNEPVFAAYYAKKRSEGKPHRVALTHVAKKLLRVIYTLQTKNIRYDPTMIH